MRLARCLENCAKDLQTKFERTKEEVLEKKKKKWGLGVGRNVSSLFSMERVKLLIPGGKEPACRCRRQKRCRF